MKANANSESGQALVQVALMLVVLLGFVALAIDIGYVYSERRHMQNAADAGALAGARELCVSGNATTAREVAEEYAVDQNGAESADVEIDANIVNVTAHIDAETFLAGILGVVEIAVHGDASAACGAASTACGLWPIAFEKAIWDSDVECGEDLVIWNAENKNAEISCVIDGAEQPLCDCYECVYKDGDPFVVMTDVSRGWLDFSTVIDPLYVDTCRSTNGCGESELSCRLRLNSGVRISLPSCIPGIHGVKAGAKTDVDARIGQVVSIPLFTGMCESTSHCTGGEIEAYSVETVGCVTVKGWDQNFELIPKSTMDPKIYTKVKSKAIIVSKNCGGCVTYCGSTNGTPPNSWELRAVNLIR